MIYNLLTALTNLLKTELSAYLPQSDQHFTLAQITASDAKPLPKISIYASKFTLEQSLKGPNFIKAYPEENQQEILVIREFAQDFFVEIYDNNVSNLEKKSSLIVAIILTNSDDLIKQYNLSPTTEYQGQQTSTTHLINQINILEGNYKTSEDMINFQLKMQVKGQLKLLRKTQGTPQPIQTITIIQS